MMRSTEPQRLNTTSILAADSSLRAVIYLRCQMNLPNLGTIKEGGRPMWAEHLYIFLSPGSVVNSWRPGGGGILLVGVVVG